MPYSIRSHTRPFYCISYTDQTLTAIQADKMQVNHDNKIDLAVAKQYNLIPANGR